jgi:lysophospholipid acyltransferase (LPLAT)-like uncharacterized protein
MTHRALLWLVTRLGPLLLRAWYSTIRIRWCGGRYLHPDPRTRHPVLYAFWHHRGMCFAYTHAGSGCRILVSQSRDGDILAGLVGALGFSPVRGSSRRGGSEAMRALLAEAGSGHDLSITPDGPRGPNQVFKVGAIYLASRSGLPIVPTSSSYHRCWRFKSWDRFQFPWPFTWGVVHVGEPVAVPPDLDEDGLETWRLRLEQVLDAHTRDTDDHLAALYRDGRRRRDL